VTVVGAILEAVPDEGTLGVGTARENTPPGVHQGKRDFAHGASSFAKLGRREKSFDKPLRIFGRG
jgi:hypothetical protein